MCYIKVSYRNIFLYCSTICLCLSDSMSAFDDNLPPNRETFKQIPKKPNTLQNWSCYRWKQLISTLEPGTYQEWYNTPIVLFFYPVCLYCICSVFGIIFLNMIQVSAKWLEKTKQFFWKWSWLLGRKYKEMSGGSRLVDNTVLLKTIMNE